VPGGELPAGYNDFATRPPETAARTDPAAHMNTMSIPRPSKPGQSLVDKFFDIAAQWHPTRNGDCTPDQVHAGTDAKAWWRCEQGHGWEAPVSRRTRQGSGCPVCTGRTVLAGFNDLATVSPDTAKEWHPTRNADRTPDQVTAGSGKKVWWRCGQGHEWEATINSRTSGGNGCPVHTRQKLLAGYNDLATRFPAIAKQWHPTRNADRTPDQVTAGHHTKVWWKCPSGHEWQAAVYSRTSGGHGCAVCARQ